MQLQTRIQDPVDSYYVLKQQFSTRKFGRRKSTRDKKSNT